MAIIKTCQPVKTITDIKLTAEAPSWVYRTFKRTKLEALLELEENLKSWARDFQNFLRDHRSQDAILLDIEREIKEVCSACGEEWEGADTDEIGEYCIICGAYQKIHIQLEQIA